MSKISLITGASRGIGAATALLLAKQGHDLCINYRSNQTQAEEICSWAKGFGVRAITVQADVSDEEQVVSLFDEVDKQLGKVTGLVNNAAILMPQMPLVDMQADRINRILRTNVTSSFLCSREAIKRMSTDFEGLGGAIVNVSSAAARTGAPGEYIDYAASKGAIDTLTKGMSLELATQGIRVNGVRPGFIYTDMHADGGEPGRVDRIKSAIPLQRGGTVEEVAEPICWLLSDAASYVTGTIIDVAGGR